MKDQRGFIGFGALIAIILGLIVIGGGTYYVMHQNSTSQTPQNHSDISTVEQTQTTNTPTAPQPPTNNPIQTTQTQNAMTSNPPATNDASPATTPPQTATTQNQTYTNAQYGFTFQYPTDLPTGTPSDATGGYGSLPPEPTNPAPIVSLLFDPTGLNMYGFVGADLVVRASNTVSYEDCTRTQTASAESPVFSNTQQLTINGQTFYKDSTGDAATGHFSNTDTYRTYYNGTCYEITDTIADSRVESRNPQPSDFIPVTDAFNIVLNSFKFTVPQTIPPVHSAPSTAAYKTYTGIVPVTFEYPSSFVAVDGAPDTGYGTEVDAKEGAQVGLETVEDGNDNGWISVQLSHNLSNPSTGFVSNMQTAMANDNPPTSHTSYTSTTLGGEPAFSLTIGDYTTLYVAHGNNTYYRILLFSPLLPNEYQTFVNSFQFTQ